MIRGLSALTWSSMFDAPGLDALILRREIVLFAPNATMLLNATEPLRTGPWKRDRRSVEVGLNGTWLRARSLV